MNWPATLVALLLAFFGVFVEAVFDLPRRWLGTPISWLPSLIVCVALRSDVWTLGIVATVGGLLADSLSANPLGVSVLPLFWIGLVIQRWREMLLGYSAYAQAVLGGLAAFASTLATVILLFTLGERPLIGWDSIWPLLAVSACGAVLTPPVFLVLDRTERLFTYRVVEMPAFRSDREIKRGRR
jgi:rod shape-determining protein MreD